jgi:hypothetical protein
MAYCSAVQVSGEFKNVSFSSSTFPTDTTVTRFIEEADAEIDDIVGLKYETPITGTAALIRIRKISIWLVAARVKEVVKVKSGVTAAEQEAREGDLRKMAMDELEKIALGKTRLTDATLRSSADGVRSYVVDNGVENAVDVEREQW